jgi:hypothetical protein
MLTVCRVAGGDPPLRSASSLVDGGAKLSAPSVNGKGTKAATVAKQIMAAAVAK